MEACTPPTAPTGYVSANGGTVAGVTANRPGSTGTKSLSVTRASAGESGKNISFRAQMPNGSWFRCDGWAKSISGAGAYARFVLFAQNYACTPYVGPINGDDWASYYLSGRINHAQGGDLFFSLLPNSAAGYYDDITIKQLTFSSLFAFAPACSIPHLGIKCTFDLPNPGMQQGLAVRWDSPTAPTSGIIAYYYGDGANLIVDQCLSGVWTQLSKKSIAAAGLSYGTAGIHAIYLDLVGTTLKVYFNETLIDTVDIDSSLVHNQYNGLFSTEGNFTSMSLQAHSAKTFTMIGDSITANSFSFGNRVPRSFPGFNTLHNRGVTGAVITHDGVQTDLADEVAAAASDDADYIFVEIGVNDPGGGSMGADFIAGITALKSSNPRAVFYVLEILPVRDNNSNHDAKRATIQAACATLGVNYLHTSTWIDPATDCAAGDGIHPTYAGHKKITAQIMPLIV
jgi:lysophospholipase L1-like esterase